MCLFLTHPNEFGGYSSRFAASSSSASASVDTYWNKDIFRVGYDSDRHLSSYVFRLNRLSKALKLFFFAIGLVDV